MERAPRVIRLHPLIFVCKFRHSSIPPCSLCGLPSRMRPLIQYYEALEAQTLWEGEISATALVAVFDLPPAESLEHVREATSSSIATDLSTTTAGWHLGGVILTKHMIYLVVFDDDDGGDEDSSFSSQLPSASSASTPNQRSVGGERSFDGASPHHAFEALLSRLPPFRVLLEDVLEAITHVELLERGDGSDAPPLVRLQTLAQECLFVLKGAEEFDNATLEELVHVLGLLPGVTVRQHVLAASEPSFSPRSQRRAIPRSEPRSTSKSGAWEQHDEVVNADMAVLIAAEPEERLQIADEQCELRVQLVLNAYRSLISKSRRRFEEELEAASKRPLDISGVPAALLPATSADGRVDEATVASVLEAFERDARVRVQKYVTPSRQAAAANRLAAETAAMQRDVSDVKQKLCGELQNVQRELHEKEAAFQEAQRHVAALTSERNELKRRETAVVEGARKREAELHIQIVALRERLDGVGR